MKQKRSAFVIRRPGTSPLLCNYVPVDKSLTYLGVHIFSNMKDEGFEGFELKQHLCPSGLKRLWFTFPDSIKSQAKLWSSPKSGVH